MTTEAVFGSSKTEKINQFLALMKDPDVQPTFRTYIENVLATSELNILKRLTTIEKILELNDYPIEDEEAESTIPKQISLLSNQMKEVIKTNNKQLIMEPIPEGYPCGNEQNDSESNIII